jgi:hypothetical protein
MNKLLSLFLLLNLLSCTSSKMKTNTKPKIDLQKIFKDVDLNNDLVIDLNESIIYSESIPEYDYSSPLLIFFIITIIVLSTCFSSVLSSWLPRFFAKKD